MKHLNIFQRDQRGVSPVIGVILMVAITVVMGAVVAGYVYGFLGHTSKAPNVSLSVIDTPTDNTSLLVKDDGGDSILANAWKGSLTGGQESSANFTIQTQLGVNALSTGTTLRVTTDTNNVAITTGWYHFVAIDTGSNAILLDTNVLVR
ncbi:MAG: type IV pilin N-terminal domain-containing protein [Dehalococcoidales bacterium]|jgi:flagellin-like protein